MAFHMASKRKVANEYIAFQLEYEKKYGPDTVVIILVGNFFEVYAVDNEVEKIGQIDKICEILGVQKTRSDKRITYNNRDHPLMAGWPEVACQKYIKLLVENNFTVVVVGQEDHPDKKVKTKVRKVTEIISPGTYIEGSLNQAYSNYLVCVLLEYDEKEQNFPFQCSLTAIDLTTGKSQCILIEPTKMGNQRENQTEKLRVSIQTLAPRELIIYTRGFQGSLIDIENLLQIGEIKPHFYLEGIDKNYWKVSYQTTFLGKYFSNTIMSVIEHLGLEKYPSTITCFLLLLQFVYEHDSQVLKKLEKPTLVQSKDTLELSMNCIHQLNLVPSTTWGYVGSNSSLFSILDQSSTALGKRLLKERLLAPLMSSKKINQRYNEVQKMYQKVNKKEMWEVFEEHLNGIKDLERLHRRVNLKKLQPAEFIFLHESYERIEEILNVSIQVYNPIIMEGELEYNNELPVSQIMNDKVISKFKKFRTWYKEKIHLENICKFNLDDNFTAPIFLPNIYQEIDHLLEEVKATWRNFRKLSETLAEKIDVESKHIRIESTNTQGYYLTTSSARGKLLQEYQSQYNLQFEKLKNSMKITNPEIKTYSNIILGMQDKLNDLNIEKYMLFLDEINKNYSVTLKTLAKYISHLDLYKAIAKVSRKNNYVKPIIVENESSFFEATELRHPIIERLNTSVPYVGNNLSLGKDLNGMFLTGLNYGGKTSMLRSIGMAIILAQCGFYVPASKFVYTPYKRILTKIALSDNLFLNQSTFVAEVKELKSMVTYGDQHSLILADEVASGTENTSAIAIVGATILTLLRNKANFVFTSHLPEVMDIPQLKISPNVKPFYIDVESVDGKFIFHRKLKEGLCPREYGVEIAKHLQMDDQFIIDAIKIRRELKGENKELTPTKVSNYNKKVYLENCHICKSNKNLNTHHITFQEKFTEDNIIPFNKNVKHNLTILCSDCHQNVHHKKLLIHGYIMTSNGIELSYTHI